MILSILRRAAVLLLAVLPGAAPLHGSPSADGPDEQLKFVVILSRHGVRSPTGEASKYDPYSALPWPKWEVPPGYLTPHGYELMRLLGTYDRAWLAQKGLFRPSGCADAAHVSILADSDERTRETGKAMAAGMFPGCWIAVHALPEGTHDPLFHPMAAGAETADPALETAAIRGRIGGDATNLTEAYRPQLSALEQVLSGCGYAPLGAHQPSSLFDVPATLEAGTPKHPVELQGPLDIASSLTENLLLEYADSMPAADVGWGCVDGARLRDLMQLHAAAEDIKDRTFAVAHIDSANLLRLIVLAMEQEVDGKAVAGAPGNPENRLLILAGHDTNIANVAGTLHLNWILDGRRDDTTPGGALVFELWRASSGAWSVRTEYMAQTLEQMRSAQPLTLTTPPDRVPMFLPGCSREDMSCTWQDFAESIHDAVRP